MNVRYIVTALGMLFTSYAMGQDTAHMHAINIDMSDETEETEIIEKGSWQIEAGYLFNRYGIPPFSSIGHLMARYGLAKRIEIRAIAEDGRERDRYIEETVQSTFPLAAGIKVEILKEHPSLPDISLLTYLKLPFTSRNSTQYAYWSPMFLFAFQHKSGNEKWKLDYNVGIQQEAYGKEWAWLGNSSLHYSLSAPFDVYLEYYAQYQQDTSPNHNVGLGASYQLNGYCAVYISGGSTVDREENNQFASAGVAIRLH